MQRKSFEAFPGRSPGRQCVFAALAAAAVILPLALVPAPAAAHPECVERSSRGGERVCVKFRAFHVHNPVPQSAREKARKVLDAVRNPKKTASDWLDKQLDK